MLGKLLKYDIRATWRDFAALYLAMVLGVIIAGLMILYVGSGWVYAVTALLALAVIIATFVVTIGTLFKIYNTNVFSREGYLTCTLPVPTTHLVFSKLTVSGMWITLTWMVAAFSMFLLFSISAPDFWAKMQAYGFNRVWQLFEEKAILLGVVTIVASIVSTLAEVAKLFLACTIAHLKVLRQFRIPVGIASFLLFTWLGSKLMNFGYALFPATSSGVDGDFAISSSGFEFSANAAQHIASEISHAMIFGIFFSLLLAAIYSVATIWLLERKLDLD